MKCQKGVTNANLNIPEPSVMSSGFFFCPNSSTKLKDSSFIFTDVSKKQQILTFESLNQQFQLLFYLKNN